MEPDVDTLAAVLARAPGVATVTALVELLVDTGGVARPAAGLSDAQVIEVVVAAEKVSRWMRSYRSTAITELASRWTGFDPAQILNRPVDRARRMRRLESSGHSIWVQ